MKITAHLLAILATVLSTSTLLAEDPTKPPLLPTTKLPIADVEYYPVPNPSALPKLAISSEPAKPQPFIGIVTAAVPAELTAQLGLPEGFGLLVQDVLPDSPAKTAGLQKYDVLKTFNDQQLVNPEQLSALVRGAGKDKEISLTLMRKGQEQRLTVKVGERLLAERPLPDFSNFKFLDAGRAIKAEVQDQKRKAEAAVDKAVDAARELKLRILSKDGELRDDPTNPPSVHVFNDKDVLFVRRDGDTKFEMRAAHVTANDESGSLDVNADDGHRTLIAKDPKGNVIFSGPIDTEEQRQAVPADVQKRLDKIRITLDRDTAYSVSKGGSVSVSTSEAGGSGSAAVVVTPRGETIQYGGSAEKAAPKSQ
jgi:PDZ domain